MIEFKKNRPVVKQINDIHGWKEKRGLLRYDYPFKRLKLSQAKSFIKGLGYRYVLYGFEDNSVRAVTHNRVIRINENLNNRMRVYALISECLLHTHKETFTNIVADVTIGFHSPEYIASVLALSTVMPIHDVVGFMFSQGYPLGKMPSLREIP